MSKITLVDWGVRFQREFPWLEPGFVHAVAEEYADEFIRELVGLGCTVASMRPRTPEDFHDHLASALGFPNYYGKNWDATHDCFRDLIVSHPFVLVWRDADKIAASDPKLFAEASSVLTREFETLGERHVRAELVITGAGPTFRGPAPRN